MKAALLIEDRDIGWVFMDANDADPSASVVELTVEDGIDHSMLEDEDAVMWLMHAEKGDLRVVSRERCDIESQMEAGWYPIPSPMVVKTRDEYEKRVAEFS